MTNAWLRLRLHRDGLNGAAQELAFGRARDTDEAKDGSPLVAENPIEREGGLGLNRMCPDFRRGISHVGVCGFQQFFQTERSAGSNTE